MRVPLKLCASLAALVAVMGAGEALAQPAAPALQAAAAPASFGHYQPPKQFTEQVHSTFYVRLRDGTRLGVTVARPAVNGQAAPGKFPVIWHHTLSATQEAADGTGPRAAGFRSIPSLTDYGYVVVQVARRGNGQSFGTMRGYHERNEDADAYEMIDWLGTQEWSNGIVGQYGCSNTGDAAMHALTGDNPHLKAVFAGCFSWNKYDAMRRGGIFAQWGTGPTRTVAQDMAIAPVDEDKDKVLLHAAALEHQRATPLFELWKSMPYRDSWAPSVQSTFWQEGSVSSYAQQVRRSGTPLYIMGGWRDELRDQGLIARMNIPGTRILIGDWLHCQNDGFALVEEIHRFFDRYLKGIDTGLEAQAPIHYFVVNAGADHKGEWREAKDWPLPQSKETPYVITPAGLLAGTAPAKPLHQAFPVDYTVTCPEGGSGSTVQPCHLPGKGLSIAGKPLTAPLEITGHALADVWIAADTKDANLFLLLEDVAPDGHVRVVTEGRLKASLRKLDKAPWALPGLPWHRAYTEDAQPLTPNEPTRLQFDIMPTSYVFLPGHKVQFTFTGSDHRERARDPEAQPKTIMLISDSAHPSTVSLPVVAH
ncbi:CocE/NonD family hydrolase [Novosphingobium sp.]|uniref:CocE/NonD family hydrolase n=1 Tax=Novosphingobium sp. TaxID=1874826 RepID=UPI0031D868AD